jgi:hypothetical protein
MNRQFKAFVAPDDLEFRDLELSKVHSSQLTNCEQ